MTQPQPMTRRAALPAFVTLSSLACGLAALEASRTGAEHWGLFFILLAACADGIDGAVARSLRAATAIGSQLDSLSDMLAFGVAPAFLFLAHYPAAPLPVRIAVALVFAASAGFRLARFNTQPPRGAFVGLPTTAAGPALALVIAGPLPPNFAVGSAITLGLALLMISALPFPKFVH